MAEPMRFRFEHPHLLHKAESHNLIGSVMFDNKKSPKITYSSVHQNLQHPSVLTFAHSGLTFARQFVWNIHWAIENLQFSKQGN
jgi:hypothetical protein